MAQQNSDWVNCLEHAVVSDIGMRRSNNQDSYAVVLAGDEASWRRRGNVFIVADGMGAHAAGELASKLAVDLIPHLYSKYVDQSAPEALQRAFIEANAEINRRGQANPEFYNMGTTGSALVLVPQGALIGHIGDSRVYRLRGEHLEQLTFDHSLVWEMKASGQSGNIELAGIVPKNVITRSLGPNSQVRADIEGPFPVAPNDIFLLCSDGLTGKVEDDELGPVLANLPPKEAAQVLADLANLRGGPDNITLIVAKVSCASLASNSAVDEPLTIGAGAAPKDKTQPIFWIAFAVCLLAAGVLAALTQWQVAAGAGAIALVVGLVAAIKTFGQRGGGISLSEGRRLGRGPYVRVHCQATSQFVERLAEIVQELRVAAEEEHWSVDMTRFNELCEAAVKATASRQHSDAVRQYARAISFMMQQLRDNGAPEDSAVNL
jgi:serine/threonine protein phosphatase PrpC